MIAQRLALVAVASLLASAVPVRADSSTLANELGSVLASEEFCGLGFDQTAIRSFIETHVKDDDMSFPSMLNLMTIGHQAQNKDMSPSQKTAHCAQISRVARAYHFVK